MKIQYTSTCVVYLARTFLIRAGQKKENIATEGGLVDRHNALHFSIFIKICHLATFVLHFTSEPALRI